MSEKDELLSEILDPNDFTDQECAIFQASLAYRIDVGEDIERNPHMLTCARCRAFYGDLRAIIDAFIVAFPPEEEPSDKVWNNLVSQFEHDDENPAEEPDAKEHTPIPGELALEGGVA